MRLTACSLLLVGSAVLANPPSSVRIVLPRPGTVITLGTQLRYQIELADSTDPAAGTVLLEVRLLDDLSKAESAPPPAAVPMGLAAIETSDCFNCHAFSSRLSGPSWREISKQYKGTPQSATTLSQHVREGTSGQWGKSMMPAHPQLTQEQATAMVAWILGAGSDPTLNYYSGTEGSFRVDVPARVLVLTATYTGPGLTAASERLVLPVSTAP